MDLIFANSSGLADISIVEFLFLVIMAGLIWRHWFYASKNSYSQFEMMLQTIINVGIVNVCLLALTSLAFYVIYAGGESLDKFMRTFYSADYLSELLAMASMIFIFYFSAPVEKNIAIETADSEQVGKNEYEPAERKQGV